MAEPTSALSPVEVEQMFTVTAELRRGEVGIVYPTGWTRSAGSPTARPSCATAPWSPSSTHAR
jgi:hypothetical protein